MSFFRKNPIQPDSSTTKEWRKAADNEILHDIHRKRNRFHINGESIDKLRKKDLLTDKQQVICELNEEKINAMGKDRILFTIEQLKKEPGDHKEEIENTITQIKKSKSDAEAQKLLQNYQKFLLKKISFSPDDGHHDLNEFKTFLEKHLLNTVKNEQHKKFLIDDLANNLHQGSYGEAVHGYFAVEIAKKTMGHRQDQKNQNALPVVIETVAESKVYLTCKESIVSLKEDLRYKKITIKENENFTKPELGENDYFARVQSTIHITPTLIKQKGKEPGMDKTLTADPLLIHIKKDQSKPAVKFFNELFPDDRNIMQKIIHYIMEKMTGRKEKLLADPPQKEVAGPRPR